MPRKTEYAVMVTETRQRFVKVVLDVPEGQDSGSWLLHEKVKRAALAKPSDWAETDVQARVAFWTDLKEAG